MQKNISEMAEKMFANMATWGIRAYLVCCGLLFFVLLIKATDSLFNSAVCMTLVCCMGAALLLFILGLVGLFAIDKVGEFRAGEAERKKHQDNCIRYSWPEHK